MSDQLHRIQTTCAYIQERIKDFKPVIGIVLGSGLGELIRDIDVLAALSYNTIPYFPQSTVDGHQGELILGSMSGKNIVAMAGRFHYYEGYYMQEVTFPIRVMKGLGVNVLLVSNAAGGMNPGFKVGDLMILTDHINLQPEHPLRGENEECLGPRFPDMSEPYTKALISAGCEIAAKHNIDVKTGVYAGVQGPSFETRAEYRYLRAIGADAVGMSTVPEVIVAVHAGMKVFAMSVITDLGIREEDNAITHKEVLEAAQAATPKLTLMFRELVRQI